MVRVKVLLKNGSKKIVAIESKKKCAQWLNLLHEPWKVIELGHGGQTYVLESHLDLQDWCEKHG